MSEEAAAIAPGAPAASPGGTPGDPDGWLLDDATRRRLIARHPPRPAIYWADLIGTAVISWASFALACTLPFGGPGWAAATLLSAMVFLRGGYFMHEVVHRPDLRGFRTAWDVLFGIPILLPSFMMETHALHHRVATYGTSKDPEWAPVRTWSRGRVLASLGSYAAIPLLMPFRFGVLNVISLFVPSARARMIRKFSAVDIHADFDRPDIDRAARPRWITLEIACFVFVWTGIGLTVAGVLPPSVHAERYLVMALSLLVNQARTLVQHAYVAGLANRGAGQQVDDSVTFEGHALLSGVLAPLGARFHALHHELPALPYHALPSAHGELMRELPLSSRYRATVRRGVLRQIVGLLRSAPVNKAGSARSSLR